MKQKTLLVLIIGALIIAACSSPALDVADPQVMAEPSTAATKPDSKAESISPDSAESTAVVSFSNDVWPILEKYAVAAHGGKGGIFLENYSDISNYVIAGDPKSSLLYKALIGDGMQQMPPGNPLPVELIQTIYDWIEQGAKDN